MEKSRLQEIRARVEKTTPGTWSVEYDKDAPKYISTETRMVLSAYGEHTDGWLDVENNADLDFILASREDISDLLAEVDRLKSLLESQESELKALRGVGEAAIPLVRGLELVQKLVELDEKGWGKELKLQQALQAWRALGGPK